MDLIRRQAAIDIVDDIRAYISVEGYWALIERLKQLPSAQPMTEPELILCKNCYWWTKQSDSPQGRCDKYGFYPTGAYYCAGARERTDETD